MPAYDGGDRPPPTSLGPDPAAVVARCRAAVAAWFERINNAFVAVALTAVAAAARYSATVPRPAALGSELLLPGMRRRPWLRLVRLVTARAVEEFGPARPGPKADKRISDLKDAAEAEAEVGKLAAEQWRRALTTRAVRHMTGYLTSAAGADAAGRIPNTGRLIASYAKWHRVSETTAYRHWQVVRELGLVRQTQHSAPGEHARYVLCFPPAQLPADLPAGDLSPQPMDLDAHVRDWDDHAGQALEETAEFGLVRYGAATSARRATTTPTTVTGSDGASLASTDTDLDSLSAYYCEAFPLYAKAKNPSTPTRVFAHPRRTPNRRGGRISDDERTAALGVLSDCVDRWVAQRGPHRLPTDAELDRMVPLLVLVLRHTPPSEVIELLTHQVRSADSLAGVLTWRLGRTLRALRARFDRPVDEDGQIYAATAALRAAEGAERHAATATARRHARQQMHAGITRANTRHKHTSLTGGLTIEWATEPPEALPSPLPAAVDAEETASRRRYALALQRARRQKITDDEEAVA
ncbi:hypothetical protein GCM10023191_101790 [Actinoallomurus oryzae]|uniref:Uncharacterized protein n=1 Tax=Actinoallomurus oryzae TaxID=502180 RepID=A0ABP8RA05_9ACTN